MELPDVAMLARVVGGAHHAYRRQRPIRARSTKFSADELRALGEHYLEQTRIQRKTAAPFFIDKMPNNFAHVGLIHLILPNAKIIDARRHPLGCCFSGFKQHFARGQNFTYDLAEIGRYYRDYVELMAHFDAVLPGRVHRVFYENMVEDTEGEVRRLLAYCGLPFEEGVPALPRKRARRAHRQLRAGPPADFSRGHGPVAALRALARAAEAGARAACSRAIRHAAVLIPWRLAYTRRADAGVGFSVRPLKNKRGSLMTRSKLRKIRRDNPRRRARC